MYNISKTILDLRKSKGYTQEQLADMLGVSAAAVSKWESGNTYPDIMLFPQIAQVFDVSIDFIFGYDKTQKKSISDVIEKANQLNNNGKIDDAFTILIKQLAQYPNNDSITFEIGRMMVKNSFNLSSEDKFKQMMQAEPYFENVLAHTSNRNFRGWSNQFIALINRELGNYEKAFEYNERNICADGVFPEVSKVRTVIASVRSEAAYRLLKNTLDSCIFEYSLLIDELNKFYMDKNDWTSIIKDYTRAMHILEEYCCESMHYYYRLTGCCVYIARAYLHLGDEENCLTYIEKAYEYAVKKDISERDEIKPIYGVMSSTVESINNIKVCEQLKTVLTNMSKCNYLDIGGNIRFKEIITKLTK